MKLKHFSLIFSIAGVLVLYFLSELTQPPLIEISEMPEYESRQVIIEGTVVDYKSTKHGGQMITMGGKNSTATIFVEGKKEVEYGDKIQATGEVQKYDEEWELVVNDDRLIRIIEEWQNSSKTLWELAEDPLKYLDLNVNVTGHIESISNAYFYLADVDEKYSLIVFYNRFDNITLYPGEKVSASGKFTFDEKNFRYQLEIYDEKHGITPFGRE